MTILIIMICTLPFLAVIIPIATLRYMNGKAKKLEKPRYLYLFNRPTDFNYIADYKEHSVSNVTEWEYKHLYDHLKPIAMLIYDREKDLYVKTATHLCFSCGLHLKQTHAIRTIKENPSAEIYCDNKQTVTYYDYEEA